MDVNESPGEALAAMLRESHLLAAHEIPDLVRRRVGAFGGLDARCYLADLQQKTLVPFVGPADVDVAVDEPLESLPVETTLAGRAYQHVDVLFQHRQPDRVTAWLPLLDGTERLGVLAVTVPAVDGESGVPAVTGALRHFASLVAELVTTKTQYSDTIVALRRQERMTLAAEMQWSLLPPLTFAGADVTVAAALEPAYEVAGDTIDYSVDVGVTRLALFDGMGHGLTSAQLAAMSVTAYRHARRAGRSLRQTCREIDDTLLDTFSGATFTTAVLAELDTDLGVLSWINAGHPEPLLLRHGRLVTSLHIPPRPPLGLRLDAVPTGSEPALGMQQLEPGDAVLFYTDGVTEARSTDGGFFGEQRLVDLIVRNLAAGLPAPETMRRVVRALLAHQQGHLDDDATLALVQWRADTQSLLP